MMSLLPPKPETASGTLRIYAIPLLPFREFYISAALSPAPPLLSILFYTGQDREMFHFSPSSPIPENEKSRPDKERLRFIYTIFHHDGEVDGRGRGHCDDGLRHGHCVRHHCGHGFRRHYGHGLRRHCGHHVLENVHGASAMDALL